MTSFKEGDLVLVLARFRKSLTKAKVSVNIPGANGLDRQVVVNAAAVYNAHIVANEEKP